MVKLTLLLCLFVSFSVCTILKATLEFDTPYHLGYYDVKRFNETTRFKIPKSRDISYLLGCLSIETSSKSDFDITFTSDTDQLVENEAWYNTVLAATKRFWRSQTGNNYIVSRCISPFRETYVLVSPHSTSKVVVKTSLKRFDIHCCLPLALGLLLFFLAPQLSRSVSFYYSAGVGFGILASALILVFVVSRMLPRKQVTYTVLLGGWGLCGWLFSYVWKNITEILLHHYMLVAGYLAFAGFVSFAVCYRYGPSDNTRTHNLIQWSIQIASVFLIYNGTQLPKVSLSIIFAITLYSILDKFNTKDKVHGAARILKKNTIFKWALGKFGDPKPRKLLSDDEFRLQGEIATQKALEELRQFCRSPHCSPWKTLSRLESPGRFASFVEGDSHVIDREMTLYEQDFDDSDDVTLPLSEESDDESIDLVKQEKDLMSEDDLE